MVVKLSFLGVLSKAALFSRGGFLGADSKAALFSWVEDRLLYRNAWVKNHWFRSLIGSLAKGFFREEKSIHHHRGDPSFFFFWV